MATTIKSTLEFGAYKLVSLEVSMNLEGWNKMLTLEFDDGNHIKILAGLNGSGKTLIMKTIQQLLDHILTSPPSVSGDIRNNSYQNLIRDVYETPVHAISLTFSREICKIIESGGELPWGKRTIIGHMDENKVDNYDLFETMKETYVDPISYQIETYNSHNDEQLDEFPIVQELEIIVKNEPIIAISVHSLESVEDGMLGGIYISHHIAAYERATVYWDPDEIEILRTYSGENNLTPNTGSDGEICIDRGVIVDNIGSYHNTVGGYPFIRHPNTGFIDNIEETYKDEPKTPNKEWYGDAKLIKDIVGDSEVISHCREAISAIIDVDRASKYTDSPFDIHRKLLEITPREISDFIIRHRASAAMIDLFQFTSREKEYSKILAINVVLEHMDVNNDEEIEKKVVEMVLRPFYKLIPKKTMEQLLGDEEFRNMIEKEFEFMIDANYKKPLAEAKEGENIASFRRSNPLDIEGDLTFEMDNFLKILINNCLHVKFGTSLSAYAHILEVDDRIKESNHLSSGQKHLYRMIMQIEETLPNSLIMIDEPEISLHIEWQRKLITWLSKWYPDRNFLIATHSPDIILDHSDKVVSIPPLGEI